MKLELVATGPAEARRWAFYVDHSHYLKLRVAGEIWAIWPWTVTSVM